ncbi:hypothetical protein O0555_21055 [Brevibacillus laterosporus]|uniref:hypothetical protein n=1 Tax=Brevibacillus laterosporus TaxID=1465 RepID=UPI00215D2380|nr:hypothetical protein [Brevibacillus laterosporus]MCR8939792.1 hypothetical protein [Brevibacillus laterosporus]MCZ0842432.1 hypothetical protein [Brevibacillus laterosporus]MCZ0846429.1 hypothetical protein [Brevibacillus laterosporus]
MDKPIAQHVTFYRAEGRYNMLNSSEVSAQYIFSLPPDAPNKLSRSFLIDLDKDYNYSNDDMTALELAEWIQSVFDSYWIYTGKKQVAELVEYLRSIEGQEEVKRAEYDLAYANYQVWYWTQKQLEYQKNSDLRVVEDEI